MQLIAISIFQIRINTYCYGLMRAINFLCIAKNDGPRILGRFLDLYIYWMVFWHIHWCLPGFTTMDNKQKLLLLHFCASGLCASGEVVGPPFGSRSGRNRERMMFRDVVMWLTPELHKKDTWYRDSLEVRLKVAIHVQCNTQAPGHEGQPQVVYLLDLCAEQHHLHFSPGHLGRVRRRRPGGHQPDYS